MAGIPVLVQKPRCEFNLIQTADASTYKAMFTAGASGSKVTSIWVTTNDSTIRTMLFQTNRSGANTNIFAYNIPASSISTPPASGVQFIGNSLICPGLPIDNDGQPYMFLQNGDILQASISTTATSGRSFWITIWGADF